MATHEPSIPHNCGRTYMICGILGVYPLPYLMARLWFFSDESFNKLWEPLLEGIFGAVCFLTASFSYYKGFNLIQRHNQQIQAHQSRLRHYSTQHKHCQVHEISLHHSFDRGDFLDLLCIKYYISVFRPLLQNVLGIV